MAGLGHTAFPESRPVNVILLHELWYNINVANMLLNFKKYVVSMQLILGKLKKYEGKLDIEFYSLGVFQNVQQTNGQMNI